MQISKAFGPRILRCYSCLPIYQFFLVVFFSKALLVTLCIFLGLPARMEISMIRFSCLETGHQILDLKLRIVQ